MDEPSSTSAVRADGEGATLVHVNASGEERTVTVDLSKFAEVGADATMTPIVTSADGALQECAPVPVVDGRASFTVPAESVTSLVVDGGPDFTG